ncbi:hypothetical protein B0H10DRAFT_1243975 [Mycena sp. CBHHK59/15]|nr:hypothetical protein B0H10DRAFT_1243975 [Mycena sp. CBHHK59/15]
MTTVRDDQNHIPGRGTALDDREVRWSASITSTSESPSSGSGSESERSSKTSRPPSFKVRILISSEVWGTFTTWGSALTETGGPKVTKSGVGSILTRTGSEAVDRRVADVPSPEPGVVCCMYSRRSLMSTHS